MSAGFLYLALILARLDHARMSERRRPVNREEFEIALICALPKESNGVTAVFDGFWTGLGKGSRDENSYRFGWICDHNVVLAHMPGMGNLASSNVAAHLKRSFPHIRLCLVVGICGGVPTKTANGDIMLGDVLVSTGVKKIDYGRLYSDQLKRKKSIEDELGRPNAEIRAFLHQLQSHQQALAHETSEYLKSLLEKVDFEQSRRPSGFDQICPSDYRHKHQDAGVCDVCHACRAPDDPVCERALKADCAELGCGKFSTRTRQTAQGSLAAESKQPIIHFGCMASSDAVIKDGRYRDRIAKEEAVIGFEMEGAGVWTCLPTIIVKGVCDYSDSHKNKVWQEYAAVTAAACMKAMLKVWISSEMPSSFARLPVRSVASLDRSLDPDNSDIPVLKSGAHRQQVNGYLSKILKSIYVEETTNENLHLTHEMTSRWVYSHPEFSAWYESSDCDRPLWLNGSPGSGKSVLASNIWHAASCQSADRPEVSRTFSITSIFYCKFDEPRTQSCHEVLGRLVFDMAYRSDLLEQEFLMRFAKLGLLSDDTALSRLKARTFWELLVKPILTKSLTSILWIIDGVDEMPTNERTTLLDIVCEFSALRPSLGSIILSRPEADIQRTLSRLNAVSVCISQGANAGDIKAYAESRIRDWGFLEDQAIYDGMYAYLTEHAEGMFQWVKLAVDEFEGIYDPVEIRQSLPKLPGDLPAMYRRLFDKVVLKTSQRQQTLLAKILSYVSSAVSPLSLDEIAALASNSGVTVSAAGVRNIVVDLCSSVLRIESSGTRTSEPRVVRVMHMSFAEYLKAGMHPESPLAFVLEAAQVQLVFACLRRMCLTFDSSHFFPAEDCVFTKLSTSRYIGWTVLNTKDGHPEPTTYVEDGLYSDTERMWKIVRASHPFLQYAMKFWTSQIKALDLRCELDCGFWALLLDGFLCSRAGSLWYQIACAYGFWIEDATEPAPFSDILDFCEARCPTDDLRINTLSAWATSLANATAKNLYFPSHIFKDGRPRSLDSWLLDVKPPSSGWRSRSTPESPIGDWSDNKTEDSNIHTNINASMKSVYEAVAGGDLGEALSQYIRIWKLGDINTTGTRAASSEKLISERNLVELDSTRFSFWQTASIAVLLCHSGCGDDALRILQPCLSNEASYSWVELYGCVLEQLDRNRDALMFYSTAAKRFPTKWAVTESLIRVLLKDGQVDAAVRLLEGRMKDAPGEALWLLGRVYAIYVGAKDRTNALACLDRGLAATSGHYFKDKLQYLLENGDHGKLLRECTNALKTPENFEWAITYLLKVQASRDPSSCLQTLREVIQWNSGAREVYPFLWKWIQLSMPTGEGADILSLACSSSPDFWIPYVYLARLQADMGLLAKAVRTLSLCPDSIGDDVRDYTLAEIYMLKGDWPKVLSICMESDFATRHENIAFVRLKAAYFARDRDVMKKLAENMIGRARESEEIPEDDLPDEDRPYLQPALALYRAGDYSISESLCRQMLKRQFNEYALTCLCQSLWALGRKEEALVVCQKASEDLQSPRVWHYVVIKSFVIEDSDAARSFSVACLLRVLQHAETANGPVSPCDTILHLLSREGKLDNLEFFWQEVKDFNEVILKLEPSVLLHAISSGHEGILNFWLERSVDVRRGNLDRLILQAMARSSFTDLQIQRVILDVLSKGAMGLNVCASDGFTALTAAILHNKRQTVMTLLEHEADPTTKDVFGLTGIDWALRKSNMVDLFDAWMPQYSPTPTAEHDCFLRTLVDRLTSTPSEQIDFQKLGYALLYLGLDMQAQIAFEQGIEKGHFGAGVVHSTVNCGGCKATPILGFRYVCRSCYDVDLCHKCREEYHDRKFDGCQDHQFLQVPRTYFRYYVKGTDKASKQRWIEELRRTVVGEDKSGPVQVEGHVHGPSR